MIGIETLNSQVYFAYINKNLRSKPIWFEKKKKRIYIHYTTWRKSFHWNIFYQDNYLWDDCQITREEPSLQNSGKCKLVLPKSPLVLWIRCIVVIVNHLQQNLLCNCLKLRNIGYVIHLSNSLFYYAIPRIPSILSNAPKIPWIVRYHFKCRICAWWISLRQVIIIDFKSPTITSSNWYAIWQL